jgi:hypothetical protein
LQHEVRALHRRHHLVGGVAAGQRVGIDPGERRQVLDLGMGYEAVFRDNDIEAAVLPELTTEDLISVGVTSDASLCPAVLPSLPGASA